MDIQTYLSTHGLSQGEFARQIGVTQGAVSQWVGGMKVSAERAVDIEAKTAGAIPRHELRPDLFPRQATA